MRSASSRSGCGCSAGRTSIPTTCGRPSPRQHRARHLFDRLQRHGAAVEQHHVASAIRPFCCFRPSTRRAAASRRRSAPHQQRRRSGAGTRLRRPSRRGARLRAGRARPTLARRDTGPATAQTLGSLAQSLQSFNGQVYQALGRPGLLPSLSVLRDGPDGDRLRHRPARGSRGRGRALRGGPHVPLVANSIQMSRLMHFSVWRMMRSYVDIFGRAAAMAAAVYGERLALVHLGVPLGLRLAALVVGGTLVYLLVTMVVAPNLLRDVRDGLLRRRVVTAGRDLDDTARLPLALEAEWTDRLRFGPDRRRDTCTTAGCALQPAVPRRTDDRGGSRSCRFRHLRRVGMARRRLRARGVPALPRWPPAARAAVYSGGGIGLKSGTATGSQRSARSFRPVRRVELFVRRLGAGLGRRARRRQPDARLLARLRAVCRARSIGATGRSGSPRVGNCALRRGLDRTRRRRVGRDHCGSLCAGQARCAAQLPGRRCGSSSPLRARTLLVLAQPAAGAPCGPAHGQASQGSAPPTSPCSARAAARSSRWHARSCSTSSSRAAVYEFSSRSRSPRPPSPLPCPPSCASTQR